MVRFLSALWASEVWDEWLVFSRHSVGRDLNRDLTRDLTRVGWRSGPWKWAEVSTSRTSADHGPEDLSRPRSLGPQQTTVPGTSADHGPEDLSRPRPRGPQQSSGPKARPSVCVFTVSAHRGAFKSSGRHANTERTARTKGRF
ncbi:uncharacterized protein V6R79_005760 [Siganus canaliculatus]